MRQGNVRSSLKGSSAGTADTASAFDHYGPESPGGDSGSSRSLRSAGVGAIVVCLLFAAFAIVTGHATPVFASTGGAGTCSINSGSVGPVASGTYHTDDVIGWTTTGCDAYIATASNLCTAAGCGDASNAPAEDYPAGTWWLEQTFYDAGEDLNYWAMWAPSDIDTSFSLVNLAGVGVNCGAHDARCKLTGGFSSWDFFAGTTGGGGAGPSLVDAILSAVDAVFTTLMQIAVYLIPLAATLWAIYVGWRMVRRFLAAR